MEQPASCLGVGNPSTALPTSNMGGAGEGAHCSEQSLPLNGRGPAFRAEALVPTGLAG